MKQEKELQQKEQEVQQTALKEKYELELRSKKDQFELELKAKDEAIAFYKDFKAKQSTKMVGESLEQHCEIEFNRLRMTAFPRAELARTMMPKREARVTISTVNMMRMALKFYPSCLK